MFSRDNAAKDQLEYSSARSTATPDYLPYSYQRTAPYLLWDDTSSSPGASSRTAAHTSRAKCCRRCSGCRFATACFVLLLVGGLFALVGVATYLGIITSNIEDPPIEEEVFEGSMRVTSGDRYSVGLRDRKSPEFALKAQTYEKLINTVYQKSALRASYLLSQVVAFQNGSLIVHFRLHLDRRKLPVEPVALAHAILLQEIESPQPAAFRSIKVDPNTVNISGFGLSNRGESNVIDFLAMQQERQSLQNVEIKPSSYSVSTTTVLSTMKSVSTSTKSSDVEDSHSSSSSLLPILLTGTSASVFTTSRRHYEQPAVSVEYGSWTPYSAPSSTITDSVQYSHEHSLPSRVSNRDRHRIRDPPPPPKPPVPPPPPPQLARDDGFTPQGKPISGTASEIKFDWETEEGVSNLFRSPAFSNSHTNNFASRAGLGIVSGPMHVEADSSQEFGARVMPPKSSSPAQQRSDEIILRMDSPTLVINRPVTNSRPDTAVAAHPVPGQETETVHQASAFLTIRNSTRKATTPSTAIPFSSWVPLRRPPPSPLRHPQSAETSSGELLQTRDDPQHGFGLRLKTSSPEEDGLLLQNQSSHALVIRLPPGTRPPSSFHQQHLQSQRLQPQPGPMDNFTQHPSLETMWKMLSRSQVKIPTNDTMLDLDSSHVGVEARVVASDKQKANNLRASVLKMDTKFPGYEVRDTRQPKQIDTNIETRPVLSSQNSNVSVVTSVSIKSSNNIVNSQREKNDSQIDNLSSTDQKTENVSNADESLTVTSIVMSVREDEKTSLIDLNTNETPGNTSLLEAASTVSNLVQDKAPSGSTVVETTSTYEPTTSDLDSFMEVFPDLLRLSAIKADENNIHANTIPTSTAVQDSVFLGNTSTMVVSVTPQSVTASWPPSWISSENDFEDDAASLQKHNTENSDSDLSSEILPMPHPLEENQHGEFSEPVSFVDSVADESPIDFLYHDEDIIGFDSNESDEESNILISTGSAENHVSQHTSTTERSTTTSTEPTSFTTTEINSCSNPTLFQCHSGECVSIHARCNRMKDCRDSSDELQCTCADFIQANVMNNTLCDGIVDCVDFSDENQCDWCSPSMYVCPNARACISQDRVCDGIADCPGGEDERSCVTVAPNLTAADSGFYWGSGLVMVRREGRWGKLCMQNFGNFVSEADVATSDLGRVLCRTMGYGDFEEVKELTEPLHEAREEGNQYYEPRYAENNSTNSRSASIQFVSTPCHSREVIQVMCRDFGCGKRIQAIHTRARIVGGSNSTPGSWPWQAAVYKEGNFMCGATLISDQWLLSAAHCFYQAVDHYWTVRLGVLRRGSHSPYERVHRLSHVILHPDYISSNFINDIILLRLAKPVEFSDYIRPICMPTQSNTEALISRKHTCTVVGWGQVDEEGDYLPDTLQEVKLPLISAEECRTRTTLLTSYARVNENMFCAGMDRGGRDACLGDSGGPIMCQEPDGRWALTGITSNGFGCARASRPGIYTKVANYMPWIMKVTEGSLPRPVRTSCQGYRCQLGKCLARRHVCDGFVDCEDGADEKGCTWPHS